MREHLAALEARITEACKIAGRSRDSVKLVWVRRLRWVLPISVKTACKKLNSSSLNRVQQKTAVACVVT